jgi:hypothetical protein
MCTHPTTEFGKAMRRDGGFHLIERCTACKVNVRGNAVWVAQKELPASVAIDSLPIFRDLRDDKREDQPDLFGGTE